MTRLSSAASAAFAALTHVLAPGFAAAKIVDAGKLAQSCREAAIVKLSGDNAQIDMLPVEQKRSEFFVSGQTDEDNPTLFECRFGKHRNFFEIKTFPPKATGAGRGAASAAVDKCVGTMGPNAKVEKVSDFGNGFSEAIMRDTGDGRHIACTAPNDGREIADWLELNY